MRIVDEHVMRAPIDLCFRVAADVERWPALLPHYRRVRFLERGGFGLGRVEMAAWRAFAGPIRYPAWWVSEMRADADEPAIYYHHVQGITRGMHVKWELEPEAGTTLVRIIHEWPGPKWPLIGRFAAEHVIGPHFVSAIARRTLAGVGAEAERLAATGGAAGAPRGPGRRTGQSRAGERRHA